MRGVAALVAILGSLVGWTGCASLVVETESPPVAVPERFGGVGGNLPQAARWWEAWGDAELTRRVERALAANLSLEAAWETLREAEAVARREGAARWPTLEAEFSGGERREDGASSSEYSAGLAAEYEVDLWRRVGAAASAAEFRAAASEAEVQAAALSLAAEVTVTYFQLIEARQQRDLLEAQLKTNGKVLTSQKARFSGGLVRSADVLRQQQLVENTRGQLALLEMRIALLQHTLAVLEGRAPGSGAEVTPEALPELPAMPRTGVPAELLQRRPDLQAAWARLRAANEDVAVAVAARFPRITLGASLETVAEDPSGLFDDWIRSLSGQVLAPLFDAGGRRAEVDRNEAVARRLLAEYGQTALEALREVEDALVRERRQAERLASLVEQQRLAQEAYRRLLNEYLNGVTEYLGALTALNQAQQLERDLLEARRLLAEYRVAVYRALGGNIVPDRAALEELVGNP